MPLFIVSCLCDEGITGPLSFRAIEAVSRLAIAESMVRRPEMWFDYLKRSSLWDGLHEDRWDAATLLLKIDRSSIDGDSRFQFGDQRGHANRDRRRLGDD